MNAVVSPMELSVEGDRQRPALTSSYRVTIDLGEAEKVLLKFEEEPAAVA